jgi:hypothetical protein
MDKAIYKNISVDIVHVYEIGDVKHATVRAVEGKPFMNLDKWPTKTSYATTTIDQLSDIIPDPQREPTVPNLLSLALEYRGKQQWSAGEVVNLWGNRKCKAFLKEENCIVNLCLIGISRSVTVFILDLHTGQWKESRTLYAEYQHWVDQIKAGAR